ncbi:transcriptional antitermination N peptide [Biostraticola tofi]|uniref:Uncharacterized protein n=1 Tax=Biostraticola tofi TaxID=466109 RepID=A0A4R3Z5S0_9GAMM|nr:hypothetical protein [Biostraticola tofi]TCW00429.1 hypothetical protein EDC52_101779 [Biostraticola tofi]
MTTIIWKESHGTAKSRHKARRAEVVESRRKDAKLERIIARTLNGCGNNVVNAIIDRPIRSAAVVKASDDNICIPDVALFAAGHRKVKGEVSARA